jgi:hypothetical protein
MQDKQNKKNQPPSSFFQSSDDAANDKFKSFKLKTFFLLPGINTIDQVININELINDKNNRLSQLAKDFKTGKIKSDKIYNQKKYIIENEPDKEVPILNFSPLKFANTNEEFKKIFDREVELKQVDLIKDRSMFISTLIEHIDNLIAVHKKDRKYEHRDLKQLAIAELFKKWLAKIDTTSKKKIIIYDEMFIPGGEKVFNKCLLNAEIINDTNDFNNAISNIFLAGFISFFIELEIIFKFKMKWKPLCIAFTEKFNRQPATKINYDKKAEGYKQGHSSAKKSYDSYLKK